MAVIFGSLTSLWNAMVTRLRPLLPPVDIQVQIRSGLGYHTSAVENQIWYEGETISMMDFYREVGKTGVSNFGNRFWVASEKNRTVRKFHSGIPKMIVDKLVSIVLADMADPEIEGASDDWDDIYENTDLRRKFSTGLISGLVQGDGAYRISWDTSLTEYPIIEWFDGLHTDYNYRRGILSEIVFSEDIVEESTTFILKSTYGYGYIQNRLYNNQGGKESEVPLTMTKDTQDLVPSITLPPGLEGIMLAVPLIVKPSSKYKYRGESIFQGKIDAFDGLDETMSQWIDSLRANRAIKYVPDRLVPKDPATGLAMKPDAFNQYVQVLDQATDVKNDKIEVVAGDIKFDALHMSYATFLDLSIQGILSPATLGIDLKKTDNADSQREKEKTTLYTRDNIIDTLNDVIPKVCECLLYVNDIINNQPIGEYDASITFGQYDSPSFDNVVKTVAEARDKNIISIERAVEELYGNSMPEEEKAKEVALIKAELNLKSQPASPMPTDDDTKLENVKKDTTVNPNGPQTVTPPEPDDISVVA